MGCNYTKEQREAWAQSLSNVIDSSGGIRTTILINAAVTIIAAIIAIVGGALLLDYTWKPDESSPIIVSSGIWGGAYMLAVGCLGLALWSKSCGPNGRTGLFYGQFGMGIGSFGGISAQVIRLHVQSYQDCRDKASSYPYCTPNTDDIVAVSLMVIIMGGVFIANALTIVICYAVINHKASKCQSGTRQSYDTNMAEKY